MQSEGNDPNSAPSEAAVCLCGSRLVVVEYIEERFSSSGVGQKKRQRSVLGSNTTPCRSCIIII